jgi:hypothetical protein
MKPTLQPGRLVVGVRLPTAWYRLWLRPGWVVIVRHNGLDKIKRLARVERIVTPNGKVKGVPDSKRRAGWTAGAYRVYVVGDNATISTDSRQFGWLSAGAVQAIVIWPVAIIRWRPVGR